MVLPQARFPLGLLQSYSSPSSRIRVLINVSWVGLGRCSPRALILADNNT